ncbi:hypothetical protein GUJ93_ZPchr0001g32040 [Zizania palustris]|uniref:Uncharacterized protein n=1 Tax=Zizania palustris TaxID=103762 RepID=A0A8J5VAL7_ZIZPA|nr:hypothetical protein GUJ93_ZPchr0001g32040 [Zizania palustris]
MRPGLSAMVQKIMALRLKCSFLCSSHTQTPCSHRRFISSIKGSRKISMSLPGCFGPEIRVVSIRYFLLWHNHDGMLNKHRKTGHVLCGFLISPKGFIPSVLSPILIFLGSSEKSGWARSNDFHCLASAGCRSFPSFFRPAKCQINSSASLGLENIRFKRSITGRYHITKAGTFLSIFFPGWSSITFLFLFCNLLLFFFWWSL